MQHLPQTLIIESMNQSALEEYAEQLVRKHLCIKSEHSESCTCDSCRLYSSKTHPDLISVEKDEESKNISITQIRNGIITKLHSRPLVSEILCVVIHNAESLSTEAQNSLLKTLEEPPEYVRIILLANHAENLLETIRSRSQVMSLETVISNSPSAPFEEGDNKDGVGEVEKILEMDTFERFATVEEITKREKKEKRKDARYSIEFLDRLILELRTMLKENAENKTLREEISNDLKKMLEGKEKIGYNANRRLVLENIMLHILNPKIYKKEESENNE